MLHFLFLHKEKGKGRVGKSGANVKVGFSSRSVLTLEVSNLPEMKSNLHSLTVNYHFHVTEEF